jgi:hypothetical protein
MNLLKITYNNTTVNIITWKRFQDNQKIWRGRKP